MHLLLFAHFVTHLAMFANEAPGGTTISPIVYLIGAAIAGGALTGIWHLWRRFHQGQVEDTELINRITQQTIQGADNILSQYRVEIEVVKRRLEDYREELHRLTKELADATLRIATLERQLSEAGTQRERLLTDLQSAVQEREILRHEIVTLNGKITELLAANPGTDPVTQDIRKLSSSTNRV